MSFRRSIVVGVVSCLVAVAAVAQEMAKAPLPAAPAASPESAKGLKVGDKAPDVTLLDAEGKEVKLSDLFAKGPVVLTFYRGGWCLFCMKQLGNWRDRLDDLKAAGGTMVAVTLEPGKAIAETGKKARLNYTVLSDTKAEAVRKYQVAYALDAAGQKKYKGYSIDLSKRNASGTWEMPNPATFVVNKESVVAYAFINPDYTIRAKVDEVIAAVKAAAPK